MSTAKDLMNLAQSMNALAIASDSYSYATNKKKTAKGFVSHGTNAMIGSSFLKANAQLIGSLD